MCHMDTATMIQVAAASNISLPTIRKYSQGGDVLPSFRRRIERTLTDLGLVKFVRAPIAIDRSPRTLA